jgi:uncharacterized membrane protein YecN with MAPEG domain
MEAMIPALSAVGIYAALNMIILSWLSNETGKYRRQHKVLIGDGGVPALTRVIRGHANAIENMPMFFAMLTLGALLGMPTIAVHVLGLMFTIGRAIHALHFIREGQPLWQRFIGFGISFAATLALTLGLLGHGVWRLFAG